MAAPRAWGNSQTTKVSSCAVMILHALATQASSSPHLFPHPTFVTPPYPFSPSLVSILSVGKAVTHSLHLLHLTDNKDWIIKEVALEMLGWWLDLMIEVFPKLNDSPLVVLQEDKTNSLQCSLASSGWRTGQVT